METVYHATYHMGSHSYYDPDHEFKSREDFEEFYNANLNDSMVLVLEGSNGWNFISIHDTHRIELREYHSWG